MKIKTRDELISLDTELNLFEDTDWDFLNVIDGTNLEYFDDVQDIEFRKRTTIDYVRYVLISFCAVLLFGMSCVYLYNTFLSRYVVPLEEVNITDAKVDTSIPRIEGGIQASSDDYIGISRVVTTYFNTLKDGALYTRLNDCCSNQSVFYSTEKLYRNNMEYSFDMNDCCARILKCFGGYFKVSRINEILCKDNKYYVYANLDYPDKDSLHEYFYVYSNDLAKYFTSCDISEQNIIRYIIKLADTYGLPTSGSEVCLEFSKDSRGSYLLTSDDIVTSYCIESYNYAISEVVKVLGANKATNQYDN